MKNHAVATLEEVTIRPASHRIAPEDTVEDVTRDQLYECSAALDFKFASFSRNGSKRNYVAEGSRPVSFRRCVLERLCAGERFIPGHYCRSTHQLLVDYISV